MFTGIIEKTAKLRKGASQSVWLDVSFAAELKIGQSVACDGVCLTVVEKDKKGFRVDVLQETRRLTHFSDLRVGSLVNVERAMKVQDRFDGHLVQGHSEGIGEIVKIEKEKVKSQKGKQTWIFAVKVPKKLMKYMILKGIIILNGIALTITKLDDKKHQVEVAIIPHTWKQTNLHVLKVGAKVNVETDLIAKYLERLITK